MRDWCKSLVRQKAIGLVFKGLESVRSDWSPLARDFQRALYECIFLGQPYAELIFATVASLRAGELDDKLVFTKRLRRRIDDYEKNVPPHIQAARKARERSRGEWQAQGSISYLMTHAGPEPVGYSSLAPDYEFYIERQVGAYCRCHSRFSRRFDGKALWSPARPILELDRFFLFFLS
jgi:DNA polymerase-2